MTVDTVNEFIKQNGAFGVLILLILGFCWWGIPYLAKRAEQIQNRHEEQLNGMLKSFQEQLNSIVVRFDTQLDRVVSGQREGMKENTQALQSLAAQVGAVNERLADVEEKIGR